MTPPSRAQDAALVYVPIIVGNIFDLRLLHASQQSCCVLGSRRLHPLSTSFSLKYIPILVGSRCSLRGLHATQQNYCVLESRRLHPPKHKISLRLSCSSKCWQLTAPPIIFFFSLSISICDLGNIYTRTSHPRLQKPSRAARLHATQ